MRYIKVFESLYIDKEEIKLWMVDLLDKDFNINIYENYGLNGYVEEDSFVIEIKNKATYQINQIIEALLFTTDMIKRKYNLGLENISLVTSPEITAGNYFNYHHLLHKVTNFNSIVDSTITNDTVICIQYKPEATGVNKYLKKFKEFDPIQVTRFVTNTIIKSATKINSLIRK